MNASIILFGAPSTDVKSYMGVYVRNSDSNQMAQHENAKWWKAINRAALYRFEKHYAAFLNTYRFDLKLNAKHTI